MLKITPAQLRALEADFRHRRRVRLLTSLRTCGWIPADMPDSTAYRRIDAAIDDARSLDVGRCRIDPLPFPPYRR